MIRLRRKKDILPDLPEPDLVPHKTAMLVVDMQYLCAHPDYGLAKIAREKGMFDAWREYYDEIEQIIPRIKELQTICRRKQMEVIFLTVSSFTRGCREIAHRERKKYLVAPKDSKEAEILEELKPVGDELVLNKFTSGAFNSTPLDKILQNMSIENLIVVGVNSNYCVETTVRDAGDRGYNVVLVDDCCAGWTREHHRYAMEILNDAYCKVKSSIEVKSLIEKY